jgi:carboxylate-amine ligase
VADGIRRWLPLLLALSTNSPFLRGNRTGMLSSRTPVYRALPRAGIPPHFGSWDAYANFVAVLTKAGAIEDYTYLWWDVRPHPNLGTVEVRVFDQQTRVDLTVALAAMVVAMAHQLRGLFDEDAALGSYPTELVDDNKIRAAVRGMDGTLLDFWLGKEERAEHMARHVLDSLHEHAEQLGCERELEGVEELLSGNTGAHRQLRLYERDPDLRALVARIVETSRV